MCEKTIEKDDASKGFYFSDDVFWINPSIKCEVCGEEFDMTMFGVLKHFTKHLGEVLIRTNKLLDTMEAKE